MNNKAVLYLRLSKEDVDKINKGDDSASIQNQRLLLTDYALAHDFEVIDVYSDDDESGLFDDRPDFVRLMHDAKLGKFNVIIAKTQARFTRNIQTSERILNHDLPLLGIRFIGVADNADTNNAGNKKTRQINSLVNEWYCEDLSNNIRSVFHMKQEKGLFVGSICCYGYIKDPQDHNHLIVDDYAASIVRRIFDLYIQGYGKQKIGSILTNENILIPSIYKTEVLGIKYHNANANEKTNVWSYQTIHQIINNETYIGTIVQNKASTPTYKDKKKKANPKDQWVKVPNMHEPIISEEIFHLAQEIQKQKTRQVGNNQVGTFAGILYCADCKHTMARKYARRNGHPFNGYVCKTYKRIGKAHCSSHLIETEDLEEAVLQSIQKEARMILTKKDIARLNEIRSPLSRIDDFNSQLTNLQEQKRKYENFKEKSYENLMEGLISKTDYQIYIEKYNLKIAEISKQIDFIQKALEDIKIAKDIDDEWTRAFKDYMNVKTLTGDMVIHLIKKIEVHEDGTIDIYYKFKNPYMS